MNLQSQPRQPPYDVEAEQSVLGGMMLDNRTFSDVSELIGEDDFYRDDHRAIWRAITSLCSARKPADFVTVSNALKDAGDLDAAGGMVYVGMLANETPSAANVCAYAEIIRERSTLRKIIAIAGDAAEAAFRPGERSVSEILDGVERAVFAIRERGMRAQSGPVGMAQLVEIAERGVELRMSAGGSVTGLQTGIVDLDESTTGLHPGDLVIIAGRPSQGKTSLAQNIAEFCALDQDKWALVFSLEMPGEQLALRTMSSRGRVPLQALRSGRMEQEQWDRIGSNGLLLRQAKLLIDETPALSPNDLRARARRAAMRNPLGLIVVDYIQLMQIPGSKENRTNEVAEISRSLKALAKELRVPVIALSQLNRGVESRENKRPRMADLRESGGIEQDADLILFIYRDEVYNRDTPHAGTAEIIIGKQRNGPLGMVRAAFLGEYCRFENLHPGWEPPHAAPEKVVRPRRGFRGMSHAAHALGDE